MPSKSLGLFPANLTTDPLFCLGFVEITNKIETVGDTFESGRTQGGWPCGKTNIFFSAPASGPLSPSALCLARSKKITRKRGMLCSGKQRNNDRKPLVMNSTPNLKRKVFSVAIFELVMKFTFKVPFELNFADMSRIDPN